MRAIPFYLEEVKMIIRLCVRVCVNVIVTKRFILFKQNLADRLLGAQSRSSSFTGDIIRFKMVATIRF